MNKDYFRSIRKPKDLVQEAYDSYCPAIKQQLERLKSDYSITNCLLLEKLL